MEVISLIIRGHYWLYYLSGTRITNYFDVKACLTSCPKTRAVSDPSGRKISRFQMAYYVISGGNTIFNLFLDSKSMRAI